METEVVELSLPEGDVAVQTDEEHWNAYLEEEDKRKDTDDSDGDMEDKPLDSLVTVVHEDKLKEVLRNLCFEEPKIVIDASKEFVRLLRGASGEEFLRQYVQASPSCQELWDAWKLQREKSALTRVWLLIATILEHPGGKETLVESAGSRGGGITIDPAAKSRHAIRKKLDKFARSIVEDKLDDVYGALSSKETSRRKAALSLMAAVVRRGPGFAHEVVRKFDFSMKAFVELAETKPRKMGTKAKKEEKKKKPSTRPAFIEFAMAFLQASDPRALRWVLQKRELCAGVLHSLSRDDDKTISFVLCTLQNKVLSAESLVPPSLQSVLLGDATLEQLSDISGNPDGGDAAEAAHRTLMMVCTDPSHGLMPESSDNLTKPGRLAGRSTLKGNPGRLLRLMLRLRPLEVAYHKDLLLAIVGGRPSIAALYMDSFPYNLEPRPSPHWFSSILLASDLVSAVNVGTCLFSSIPLRIEPPNLDSSGMQTILKCILPSPLTRLVINRGLLHSNVLVRHGSLRILLEALKSMDNIIAAINIKIGSTTSRRDAGSTKGRVPSQVKDSEGFPKIIGFSGSGAFPKIDEYLSTSSSANIKADGSLLQRWSSFRQGLQDEFRAILPDPQVLLKLLSSLSCSQAFTRKPLKRKELTTSHETSKAAKRSKSNKASEDVDIFISGIASEVRVSQSGEYGIVDDTHPKEDADEMQNTSMIAWIWSLDDLSFFGDEPWNIESYFHSKLLDAVTLYMRTIPDSLVEGSYDFFKILPSDPMTLSTCQVQSLLSLLLEYVQQYPRSRTATKGHELRYKHLQPLIKLMLYSPTAGIRNQACVLAREAMLSTGAFDGNVSEIESWFMSLPAYVSGRGSASSSPSDTLESMTAVLVPFFCDAVSTVGNNLHKYLHQLCDNLENITSSEDTPDFGPLILCILQKCMRVLESDTKTFKLIDRCMISSYVGNSLKLLLQIQLGSGLLASLIISILTEKFCKDPSVKVNSHELHCEWRPLMNLLCFAQSMKCQDICKPKPIALKPVNGHGGSLTKAVYKALKMVKEGHNEPPVKVAAALCSSLLCADLEDLVHNFPALLVVFKSCFGDGFEFLFSTCSIEHGLLAQISRQWSDIFPGQKIRATVTIDDDTEANEVFQGNSLMTSSEDTTLVSGFSDEFTVSAFNLFLRRMPLCIILPTIICFGDSRPLDRSEITDLLKSKISEASSGNIILLLRFILFWLHQVELYYGIAPSSYLEQQICLCFLLIEVLLIQTLASTFDPVTSQFGQADSNTLIVEVVDIIFHHPAVTMFLLHPTCTNKDKTRSVGNGFKDFLFTSKQYVSPIDLCVLHLLRNIADSISKQNTSTACSVHDIHNAVKNACRNLLQRLLAVFREDFEWCILENRNQVPCFASWYVLSESLQYISPFVLLETANWVFCKMEMHGTHTLAVFSPVSAGMYIAEMAFKMLPSYLVHGSENRSTCSLFWESSVQSLDLCLVEKVYFRVLDFSMSYQLENADLCLLNAVVAAKIINKTAQPQVAHLPLSMAMLRMITESPIEMVVHCMHKIDKVKSKLLSLITEMSPHHLNYFGKIFLSMVNKKGVPGMDILVSLEQIKKIVEQYSVLGTEDKVMLLPTVHLYFSSLSNLDKDHAEVITEFVSGFLLDGSLDWQNFVTSSIFLIDPNEVSFTSTIELPHLFSFSVLGKFVHLFHYYIDENLDNKKWRKALFNSVFTSLPMHDEILMCDANEVFNCSYEQLLNLVNGFVAKLSLLRMLLYPKSHSVHFPVIKADEGSSGMLSREISSKVKLKPKLYFRLMICLVVTLDKIVQRCSLSVIYSSSQKSDYCSLFARFLEITILRNLVELSAELGSDPVPVKYLTFLEPFTRSSLVYRFEDPATLRAMRTILLLFSRCSFNFNDILNHLLAHSLFIPTILWCEMKDDLSFHDPREHLSLRSASRVLQLLTFYDPKGNGVTDKVNTEKTIMDIYPDIYHRKLEVVKLLRALVLLKAQNICLSASEEVAFNPRDLVSLLLSGYGATMNEIDLEVCKLMHEIEFVDGSDGSHIAVMNFLWGSSASKIRTEQILDKLLSVDGGGGGEIDEEYHKRTFKENLAVDSRYSLMTVLNFPYHQHAWTQPASLDKLLQDSFADMSSASYEKRRVTSYDPDFILRFSIHGLSRGFFEPIEFARLGLLAIAFVSIASTDEGIRKMGYDALGNFKQSLEDRQAGKVGLSLRLLLAYLQNGILEPWQKIPSVIAVFAAEASLILMNPQENQYLVVNQLLTRFSKVNLQAVPLFHALLGSGTINFQRDLDWILRLCCVGLNLVDDALIVKRSFVFELLLSFHASALVSHESRTLILQIVKKAAKLPLLVQHLVENCGIISWLSSLLASCTLKLYAAQNTLVYSEMVAIFEVLTDILSDRRITLWLRKIALEQLSEISSQIHSIFLRGSELLKGHTQLLDFFLEILILTMKISARRKIYKPHFSLSLEGLYHVYLAVEGALCTRKNRATAELGVKCILMSSPPEAMSTKDKSMILKLVMWCITTSTHLLLQPKKATELKSAVLSCHKDDENEADMREKLLRWMAALVIRGEMLSSSTSVHNTELSRAKTLQNLLEQQVKDRTSMNLATEREFDGLLAAIILYLQQLQGMQCTELRSVVSAMCLLLPFGSKISGNGAILLDDRLSNLISFLSSHIHCPVETNPAWRWSYHQPWRDLSADSTDENKRVEVQACQSLLVIFSYVLSGNMPKFPVLLAQLAASFELLSWDFTNA
ncbi:uncharacterized protein LOC116254077 isoform X1 [Nymphaea colorata]|nr:uncharacterized protein LOC116254077 isoform X1 [Nymphaea colorata]